MSQTGVIYSQPEFILSSPRTSLSCGCGCFAIPGNGRPDTRLIAKRRSNQQRKINNVSDRIRTEQAGRFLNFLQVFGGHAERKSAQAISAGNYHERNAMRISAISGYPDWGGF